jgi:hypothetical protein
MSFTDTWARLHALLHLFDELADRAHAPPVLAAAVLVAIEIEIVNHVSQLDAESFDLKLYWSTLLGFDQDFSLRLSWRKSLLSRPSGR